MATMLNKFRKKHKKSGKYNNSAPKIAMPTGFTEFDFKNGRMIPVFDLDKQQKVDQYMSLGILNGSINTIVGPTGLGKTTLLVSFLANLFRNPITGELFETSHCEFADSERTMSFQRAYNILKEADDSITMNFIHDRFHLFSTMQYKDGREIKEASIFHEGINDMMEEIAEDKQDNPDEYKYDTGLRDEFGTPIFAYEPTFFFMDSLPTVFPLEVRKEKGWKNSSRLPMETAKANAQLFKRMTGLTQEANINMFVINHVNDNVDMGVIKQAAKLNYLSQSKSIPGGNAPLFYSNLLLYIKQLSGGKMEVDKGDPFNGYLSELTFIKSRSNISGQRIVLPYDQKRGFDRVYHKFELLNRLKLLAGSRSPYYYVPTLPDVKFGKNNFKEQYLAHPELRQEINKVLSIYLSRYLSCGKDEELDYKDLDLSKADTLSDVEVEKYMPVKIDLF